MPVLEAMLEQFPFPVRGFHSDNGSEFINHRVAELLNNLLAEQTKSRPRHSNDNGLAESKNGAVVRKNMGYGHIRAIHAEAINEFYREHFKPYLNFHRPCGVPEVVTGAKGKQRRIYRWYATPWEIPRQLPDLARYLKPDCTVEDEPESRKRERYVERWTDAERKTEAVRHFRAQADRKKTRATEGRGNDGLWNTRKTKRRFSKVSHSPRKSPKRDSHIPTAAATTARKSGNPEAGFPLSRRGFYSL